MISQNDDISREESVLYRVSNCISKFGGKSSRSSQWSSLWSSRREGGTGNGQTIMAWPSPARKDVASPNAGEDNEWRGYLLRNNWVYPPHLEHSQWSNISNHFTANMTDWLIEWLNDLLTDSLNQSITQLMKWMNVLRYACISVLYIVYHK